MADRFFLQTILGSKTPPPRRNSNNNKNENNDNHNGVAERVARSNQHANVYNNNNDDNSDDPLPEGVDFSEGGWATDFAAALTAGLFFISGLYFYYDSDNNSDKDKDDEDQKHFLFLYGGTFLAHLFGGLAHRWFPNRAQEGVGHYGFYLTMMVGYSGNCLRYGYGWNLGWEWEVIALVNIGYLVVAGLVVMIFMTPTNLKVDHVPQEEGQPIFWADRLFGLGEAVCSVLEVVASIYFIVKFDDDDNDVPRTGFLWAAVVANWVGWFAVYFFALLYVLYQYDYDPSLMQRIFHYCMIVMMWGIDAHVQYLRKQEASSS
ncbi:hypothetical protein ACA910_006540 [Epithemia clementina (nom. ined.)]